MFRLLQGFPPEIAEALGACIERLGRAGGEAPKPLAVFDWDNTCIANDIGDASYDVMARHARVALRDGELDAMLPEALLGRPRRAPIRALLAAARGGDADAARELRAEMLALYEDLSDGSPEGETARYRWVAAMMGGRTGAELEALADEAIEEGLSAPLGTERVATRDGARSIAVARGMRILRPMAGLIAALLEGGWDVRIVSASCAPLVRAFARRAGVAPSQVIGVRLTGDPGHLAPQVVDPFPYREGKVAAIERYVGRLPHLVAGDSPGDVAMLRASQALRLVVERRADAEPVRIARAEGPAAGWHVVSQAALLEASA